MCAFDMVFPFDARLLDMFDRGASRGLRVYFFGLINDDALKLGFFVEEIRDVKKRVALQPDVHEGGLHAGQDAHHAAFINIPDDALILLASFDVELRNAFVFDDRDLLFFTVNTNN